MTDMTSAASKTEVLQSAMVRDVLNEEELQELRQSTLNVQDLTEREREDVQDRFRAAFERADRVVRGVLEPLSA